MTSQTCDKNSCEAACLILLFAGSGDATAVRPNSNRFAEGSWCGPTAGPRQQGMRACRFRHAAPSETVQHQFAAREVSAVATPHLPGCLCMLSRERREEVRGAADCRRLEYSCKSGATLAALIQHQVHCKAGDVAFQGSL